MAQQMRRRMGAPGALCCALLCSGSLVALLGALPSAALGEQQQLLGSSAAASLERDSDVAADEAAGLALGTFGGRRPAAEEAHTRLFGDLLARSSAQAGQPKQGEPTLHDAMLELLRRNGLRAAMRDFQAAQRLGGLDAEQQALKAQTEAELRRLAPGGSDDTLEHALDADQFQAHQANLLAQLLSEAHSLGQLEDVGDGFLAHLLSKRPQPHHVASGTHGQDVEEPGAVAHHGSATTNSGTTRDAATQTTTTVVDTAMDGDDDVRQHQGLQHTVDVAPTTTTTTTTQFDAFTTDRVTDAAQQAVLLGDTTTLSSSSSSSSSQGLSGSSSSTSGGDSASDQQQVNQAYLSEYDEAALAGSSSSDDTATTTNGSAEQQEQPAVRVVDLASLVREAEGRLAALGLPTAQASHQEEAEDDGAGSSVASLPLEPAEAEAMRRDLDNMMQGAEEVAAQAALALPDLAAHLLRGMAFSHQQHQHQQQQQRALVDAATSTRTAAAQAVDAATQTQAQDEDDVLAALASHVSSGGGDDDDAASTSASVASRTGQVEGAAVTQQGAAQAQDHYKDEDVDEQDEEVGGEGFDTTTTDDYEREAAAVRDALLLGPFSFVRRFVESVMDRAPWGGLVHHGLGGGSGSRLLLLPGQVLVVSSRRYDYDDQDAAPEGAGAGDAVVEPRQEEQEERLQRQEQQGQEGEGRPLTLTGASDDPLFSSAGWVGAASSLPAGDGLVNALDPQDYQQQQQQQEQLQGASSSSLGGGSVDEDARELGRLYAALLQHGRDASTQLDELMRDQLALQHQQHQHDQQQQRDASLALDADGSGALLLLPGAWPRAEDAAQQQLKREQQQEQEGAGAGAGGGVELRVPHEWAGLLEADGSINLGALVLAALLMATLFMLVGFVRSLDSLQDAMAACSTTFSSSSASSSLHLGRLHASAGGSDVEVGEGGGGNPLLVPFLVEGADGTYQRGYMLLGEEELRQAAAAAGYQAPTSGGGGGGGVLGGDDLGKGAAQAAWGAKSLQGAPKEQAQGEVVEGLQRDEVVEVVVRPAAPAHEAEDAEGEERRTAGAGGGVVFAKHYL